MTRRFIIFSDMSEPYTVYIENSVERSVRTLVLKGPNPMHVHKEAYMKSSKNEEIQSIEDSEGSTVFDLKRGFAKDY